MGATWSEEAMHGLLMPVNVTAGGDGPDLVQLLAVEGLGAEPVCAPPRAQARLQSAARRRGAQAGQGRCRQQCGTEGLTAPLCVAQCIFTGQ